MVKYNKRDKDPGEYGATRGTPARNVDGTKRDLRKIVAKESAGEQARVARIVRNKDLPSNTQARVNQTIRGGEVVKSEELAADKRKIELIRAQTNGYSDEADRYGDQVSS